MAEQRIPRADGDFSAAMNHYTEAVGKWWAHAGLDPLDLEPLNKALQAWNAGYAAHIAAQAAAHAATQKKDDARRTLEGLARPLTAFIQTYPTTTDADRAAIGITVKSPTPRALAAPTTRPLAVVRGGGRLTHTLRLSDESTPTRRAKPRGVLGAEVWVGIAPTPDLANPDPAAMTYLALATDATVTTEFRVGDGGKTAVYLLRWINPRGERGPWSAPITATIAA